MINVPIKLFGQHKRKYDENTVIPPYAHIKEKTDYEDLEVDISTLFLDLKERKSHD